MADINDTEVKRSEGDLIAQKADFEDTYFLFVSHTDHKPQSLIMAVKSTLFLLILAVILAELPRSFSFQLRKRPNNPLIVYYKNRTNVELRWEWTLSGGEIVSPIKIKRYRKSQTNTEAIIATYFTSPGPSTDTTKYSFNVVNSLNGYASFVIKDITNQGNINVMAENEVYMYKIAVDEQTGPVEHTDEVELKTLKTPSITTYPKNQTATGGTVSFECAADGKPTPTITWEKIGSSQSFSQGSKLTINDFDASKVGVYRCTAKSVGIAENATATGTVQLTTCGSGCNKEDLGIEFPDLTYNYEYENPSYNKYKELKNNIETACIMAYGNSGKTISKCEVKGFRRGSVVAVVELGYPTNTVDPKQPLLQAINGGNFAGQKVNTGFVSPTSAPTQEPPSTEAATPATSSDGPPDSGQRANDGGGLSTGAIIALVVVFSIIFIVIIVVLIVCMLKRKKPSDTRKPYKEDGRVYDKPSAAPLKSQPFDPTYDDPNEDRYPNGGGPPPQYTPSSNYAEVKPSEQDDSQMEWDKSLKDEMWI